VTGFSSHLSKIWCYFDQCDRSWRCSRFS